MSLQANVILIGVKDVQASKRFYADGMGCKVEQDQRQFVRLDLGEGSAGLALYQWDAAARDAGVASESNGFRGGSFHYLVSSSDEVDKVIAKAIASGGSEVKPAASAKWGGYFGYFADPDGHLWKVAAA